MAEILIKIKQLLKNEATSGILIVIATIAALICENTILSNFYNHFLRIESGVIFGHYSVIKPLILWVNDGLMALFFFTIGLEVKREILVGELSHPSKVLLPVVGGLGGVILPTIVFILFNFNNEFNLRGWAIPTVSDTAFAVGVLLLLGSKVPSSLKLFLLLLAIIDDICAVIIIALFYSHELSNFALMMALVCVLSLILMNIWNVRKKHWYATIGILLWLSFLESGIHSTIAGIIAAIFIPLKPINGVSLLEDMEHHLKDFVTYLVMPLFAFVNAGISINSDAIHYLAHPVSIGIMVGLLIGKPLGVFLFSYFIIKNKWAKLPAGSTIRQFLGLSFLTAIGASMSLFIDSVAYADSDAFYYADKLAILLASFIAAIIGWSILYTSSKQKKIIEEDFSI